jgi:hypothetical protein
LKPKIILLIGIFLLNILILAGCSAMNSLVETPSAQNQGIVRFSCLDGQLINLATTTTDNVTSAVITIKDAKNNIVKDKFKLNLTKSGILYLSDNLTLPIGDFTVTEFFVTDKIGNVLYSTPIKGSESAKYVTNPLPYSLKVEKDVTKSLPIEIFEITGSFINNAGNSSGSVINGNITVNTTWKKSQSPILLNGTVTVQNGATVTIEPGVEVKILGNYQLIINGELIAIGTDTEKIYFTSDSQESERRDRIYFTEGSTAAVFSASGSYASGSILKNCVIEKMDTGIYLAHSSPYITNNIIRANRGGIYNYDSQARIENNLITKNQWYGIYGERSEVRIINNIISFNTAGGIDGGASTITHNDILNNGLGLSVYASAEVSFNNIKYNTRNGILLLDASANNIHNNNIYGNQGYQYFKYNDYDTSEDNASDNYWGTSDLKAIPNLIYDYYDSPNTSGKVIYSPIKASEISGAGPQ